MNTLIVLILPLLSFLSIAFCGSFIGTFGSMFVSCINIILAWIFSIFFFYYISNDIILVADVWSWININELPIDFSLKYDSLTSIMFIVVTTISSIVHVYSCVYMYTDPFLSRFMSYLSLFTFFMLLLVSSGNLLILFFGWEGVGLCSYLLIGFWYTRLQAGKAATKAFIINKIGDLFFLLGISYIFMLSHSIEFSLISLTSNLYLFEFIEVISFLLFIGAVGKSAQIGLHTWLPDAMEGPTPVSALIHAATMVTAGVFLIIRCSIIIEYAPRVLYIIAIWGGITALISGTIGAVQSDIKKIIAYSTCSQLGYMVLACGLSFYNVGFFHLFNHAFFKALLFLSAGSVIHLMSNEQDIFKMGGLGSLSPFVYINVLIGSFALAGFPFLAGFFSKDLIIELSNTEFWLNGQSSYWLSSIAAILTMYYSIRLLIYVFLDKFSGFKLVIKNHHKITNLEIILLGILGLLSIITGFYFKDLFVGFGSNYFNNSIVNLPNMWSSLELEFIPYYIKIMPVVTGIISLIISFLLNTKYNYAVYSSQLKIYFESCKWFYNELVNIFLSNYTLTIGRVFFEQYEKRVLELYGPLSIVFIIRNVIYNKYMHSK
jgi:proton-translocating NADH-quinone oxidoreductase chain L